MIKEEIISGIDLAHNFQYLIKRLEQYKDDLSKDDIIQMLKYYYLFNKDIFNGIL